MGSITPDQAEVSAFTPHRYPPFPPDTRPVAHLDTFSLTKLLAGELAEQARLFETCKTRGFFYLDFTTTSVEMLPEDAEAIGQLSERVFRLPMDEKLRYKFSGQKPNSILGYDLTSMRCR